MTEEEFRLILNLANSSKDVSDLVGKLDLLKGKVAEVGGSYEVLDKTTGSYSVSTQQVASAQDLAVAAAVEQTRAQKALNIVLEQTAAAQNKASGTSREMQMRILNLGRAAQDLAQGGFAGIINNIEGIVGGGGILAGVLTAVGTAAFLATPYIKEWVKSLGEGYEKFKPTYEGLQAYTEAINKNKTAIGELKAKQELTYFELLKYKQLVGETTELEEKAADAAAARAVKAGSDKMSVRRASAVRETISETYGSGEELVAAIMHANPNMTIDRANKLAAEAQTGIKSSVESLGNMLPGFREKYTPFSPERQDANKLSQDAFKDEQKFLAERMKTLTEREREKEQHKKEAEAEASHMTDVLDKEGKVDDKSLDAQMRRTAKRVQGQIQNERDVRGGRAIQREQAAMGNDINLNDAVQYYKQTQAELKRTQADTLQTLIGGVSQLGQELRNAKMQNANAKAVTGQNRTASTNGIN